MRNPFRHMDADDHRPRESGDDTAWRVDRSRDETRSFDRTDRESSMRDHDRMRDQGRYPADDRPWSQTRSGMIEAARFDDGRGRYGEPTYDRSSYAASGDRDSHDRRYARQDSGAYRRDDVSPPDRGPQWTRDRSQSWAGEHAPGSDSWRGSDARAGRPAHHDFEPDYLHWREQQLSTLDKDYADWRNERREKFSADFDSWRQTRAHGPRIEAENPVVGDVSDGGVGTQHKKS